MPTNVNFKEHWNDIGQILKIIEDKIKEDEEDEEDEEEDEEEEDTLETQIRLLRDKCVVNRLKRKEKDKEDDEMLKLLLLEDYKNKNPSLKNRLTKKINLLKEKLDLDEELKEDFTDIITLVNTIEEAEIKIVEDAKNPKRNKARQEKVKNGTINKNKLDCPFKCKSYRTTLDGIIKHLPKCVRRPSNSIGSEKSKTDIVALNTDKNLKSILAKEWKVSEDDFDL
jgi:hypothetical protein